MKLVIFQGNPGLRYRKTRHNVGWGVADFCAKQRRLKWKNLAKFFAEIAEFTEDGQKILLVKPQKFYNLTGEVVQNLAKFYKIPPRKILVVCDDLNLDFGKIRYREQGSAGGNNGLKSIIAALGDNFPRLRIGTDNPAHQAIGDTDFVLSKFTRAENQKLPEIIAGAAAEIDKFISGDL
jgi:PTH1 family peptidyl-tRNA hydrolase